LHRRAPLGVARMGKAVGMDASLDFAVGTLERHSIQRKTKLKPEQFEVTLHQHQKRRGLRPFRSSRSPRPCSP